MTASMHMVACCAAGRSWGCMHGFMRAWEHPGCCFLAQLVGYPAPVCPVVRQQVPGLPVQQLTNTRNGFTFVGPTNQRFYGQ